MSTDLHSDLPFHSLANLRGHLARGDVSSVEIVEACLARIARLDARLHAFVDVYRDGALAWAQAADLERQSGLVRGPLAGLPIALKDLLHWSGRQTTAGAKSWLGRISETTATVVERVLAAGMIPIGKTHMVEFAFGGWGRNEPMGTPWNPWDTQTHRVPGGSSSGSAVAVAAGLVPAAIGSDTGGSVRIPASLCGLTGLKPTYGLVSLAGAVPLSTTLDSIGPLAHSVDDAALVTAAIAGADPRDPATGRAPHVDLVAALEREPDIAGMRITCLTPEQYPLAVDDEVQAALVAAIDTLRELGARVEETRVPLDFGDLMGRNGRLIAAEAFAVHRAYIDDMALPVDPWVRARTRSGRAVSAADYIAELAVRERAMRDFAAWMRGRDALVTPTLPTTATPVGEVDETATPLATFTRAANYLGACALSLPAGHARNGLPIGVQLIGGPFTEATLVTIGRAFQLATDWHLRRPDLGAWERA
jgi:aspartyl-tRNA(Asn)/glutamyl-tRNA(Gln) amidotransferase subunit A